MADQKIILLTDIIEQKVRKEKEIEFYKKQLEDITQKMWFLQKELDLTNLIIEIIENEKVVDIHQRIGVIGNDSNKN